jgi:glutathione S-transferase
MAPLGYTVYGRATSSNVQALIWCLEELAVAYTRLDYGEVFGGLDSPTFRALTPHGKIPVLVSPEGQAIWETPAILRYLAERHGTDAFWPRDPSARAEVDMWAEWAKHSVAEAFTGPIFWRHIRTAAARRDVELVQANLNAFEAELAKAEPRLEKQAFLCGQSLTLADIQFGHVLFRYFDFQQQSDARDRLNLTEMPALRRYYSRLNERPAYQKAVMVSYETLRNTF